MKQHNHNYDIICIGLGISGLYFGYKSIHSNKNILFLEKSDRVGGRIQSVKISDDNKYYAEGCATRFFKNNDPPSLDNDGYVMNLLDKLNISSTSLPNNMIKSNTNYIDVVDKINSVYPNIHDKYAKQSFPNTVMELGYSIDSFSDNSGYPVFKEPMNLNIALYALKKFSSDTQYVVDGGYESICDKLYCIIKDHHSFKFNKSVQKIEYDGKNYLINDKYAAKKILFTGTANQLLEINIDIPHLYTLKNNLIKHYFNYRAIRIYIKVKHPWWNKSEISYRWNSETPLNQISYYDAETILIYSNMSSADILHNMIPKKYKPIRNFVKSFEMPELSKYISDSLIEIIGAKNVKVRKIWFKYTSDAVQFVKPIDFKQYDDFINNIQENNGFFMMSGDYTKNPGWVNSCLYLVESRYKKILK